MPPLPRISLVTPSYNQGAFLDATIRSVLEQDYPDIEYVVVDGGSTDESVDVIRRHAHRLAHWSSERDGGQYDAINKGFAGTSGEVMGWLNSDDKHLPWTLAVVGELFATFPDVRWVTTLYPLFWDARGVAVRVEQVPGFSPRAFWRGENLPGAGWKGTTAFVQQESTFWRRGLWDEAGGRLDASLPMAGDFELWARFFRRADLHGVATPLAGFRVHGGTKTGGALDRYTRECAEVFTRMGGRPLGRIESRVRDSFLKYVPRRVQLATGWHERRPVLRWGVRGWEKATI